MSLMHCPIQIATDKKAVAIVSKKRAWTYGELDQCIEEKCKVIEGTVLPFIARPSFESIVLLFAALRLKRIAFPLSFRLTKIQIMGLVKDLVPRENTATYLLTSGTTATPKIACHSFANHIYSALGSNKILPLLPTDRWLLSLPLFHIGGIQILFRCFLAGCSVALDEVEGITHYSYVPTQLYRLLKGKIPAPIKGILLGGAPIAPALFEQALALGLPVFPSYGMTEMTSQITTNTSLRHKLHFGKPLPFREVKIAADGEILVRGETLFQGYLNQENIDGWFATKDLGKWDEDNNLCFLGRKDKLFISGGENIQPEEIENALLEHPRILEAKVVPVEDKEYGARPVAYVRGDVDKKELEHFLRERLPSYKIPLFFKDFQ